MTTVGVKGLSRQRHAIKRMRRGGLSGGMRLSRLTELFNETAVRQRHRSHASLCRRAPA